MRLFDGFRFFFDPSFAISKFFTLWAGGGGGNQTSTGTTYSTNLPEYAKPYFEELLKQTGKNVFNTVDKSMVGQTDPTTGKTYTEADIGNVTGVKDASSLPQQTAAGFTDLQNKAQSGIANLQAPGDFANASAGLNYGTQQSYNAMNQGLNQALNYQPGKVQAQNVYNPQLQQFQMRNAQDVNAPELQQYSMGAAQTDYNPNLQNYQMQGPKDVASTNIGSRDVSTQNVSSGPGISTNQIQAAQSGYNPDLQNYQMQGPRDVTAASMTGRDVASYMSPYQQEVTNTALRQAQLQGDLQKQQGALGAIGRGTFGGARQALMQAEQQRGVNQQLADIQYKGQQDAYTQAQAQFNADQARKLQAATANQQAGLTTGQQNLAAQLATQQLKTQTGRDVALANLTNQQQANVQSEANKLQAQGMTADNALKAALANQQSGLQAQQSNQQASLEAQKANQQSGLQAALANQQAGLTAGQQNLAANLATQQLGAQTGVQTALANLNSRQQANVQNLAAQLQTQGLSADAAMKAALANQQTRMTTNQQNLAAKLGIQQLASGQSMEAQKANQAAGLQADQLNQQAEQYAAGLGRDVGLAGLQAGMTGSTQLGALANTQQIADLQRLAAQATTGAEQQALNQKIADLQYQNKMAAQNYQKQQIQYYSDILRGNAGALGSTAVQYAPQPSAASQIGGLGLGALGLAKAMG